MKKPPKLSAVDQQLFSDAMRDVQPLKPSNKSKSQPPAPQPAIKPRLPLDKSPITMLPPLADPASLNITGQQSLSFHVSGISPKIMQQLKTGKYQLDATLDLHGYTAEQAQTSVTTNLINYLNQHYRCILIIHGKGAKPGSAPKLKNYLNHWLRQIPQVLAFCSALPRDGGTGAVYVLLKNRSK